MVVHSIPTPYLLFSLSVSRVFAFINFRAKTLARVLGTDFPTRMLCNFTIKTMVEKPSKKQKKGFISEADISSLLQRYTTNTVLALLQEVAQFPGVKLDWNALVKNTSTGISNAREYQMLWKHLAYRNALLEKLEDQAQPLDDDSDLEYELEALPVVSGEASTEAAACVKVLIASGLPSDSSLPNSSTVEAPLTINIPNSQSIRASSENSQPSCLMQGMNITVPVSVKKLPLPTSTSAEGLDANGSIGGSMPPRKRRKPWTPEEDVELISAVQKCGEGNWANILRGDFKWDRTASQLSQRWNILRKKHGSMILGSNLSGSQLSEAQLAARHAMSLALDMPVKNITASCTNNTAGTTSNNRVNNSVPSTANAEALPVSSSFMQAPSQSQQGPVQTKSSPVGSPSSVAKSRIPFKKMPVKSNFSADSSIRAAAVAAGARIVTSSDAASLLKVAQAKNAIHIMPSVVSSIKSSIAGSAPAHLEASSSARNVRTSLPTACNLAVSSSASHPGLVKAASPKVQHNTSSEQTNAVISVPGAELQLKLEAKAGEEIKVSDLCSVSGNESSKEVQVDKTALPKPEAELKNQEAVTENPDSCSNMEVVENDLVHINGNQAEGNKHDNDDKMMDSPVQKTGNQAAAKENCELQSPKNKEPDLPTMSIDECCKNLEVSSEAKASNH